MRIHASCFGMQFSFAETIPHFLHFAVLSTNMPAVKKSGQTTLKTKMTTKYSQIYSLATPQPSFEYSSKIFDRYKDKRNITVTSTDY